MDNKKFNDDYNKDYFYFTFDKKLKWILLGILFSTILKDGWLIIIGLIIFAIYGLYKQNKIMNEIENNKNK